MYQDQSAGMVPKQVTKTIQVPRQVTSTVMQPRQVTNTVMEDGQVRFGMVCSALKTKRFHLACFIQARQVTSTIMEPRQVTSTVMEPRQVTETIMVPQQVAKGMEVRCVESAVCAVWMRGFALPQNTDVLPETSVDLL